ncbi:MAG: polyprenyl synthetase family protein [Candidatus Omnitrophica bacterium]|nr:polyprenyl synthetase family protein [Candidatus Omnitrophota bacterium]
MRNSCFSGMANLDPHFQGQLSRLEQALDQFLPKPSQHLAQIHEAMRYAVLNGGKRIRPLLTLVVCEMLGGNEDEAMIPACAIELIHSYSLVHDDLPCLDNDEFRRGQLTCHKKFGEAIALLAGDGLLTLAFHLISTLKDSSKVHRLLKEISEAVGTFGMVGGQVMDISIDKTDVDLPTLDAIHIHKTGQLIKTSCLAGAISAGANAEEEARISKFGEYLGFAFQIIDDILDGDGYLRFMSAHEARAKAREVIAQAKKELKSFENNSDLIQMTDFILNRSEDNARR